MLNQLIILTYGKCFATTRNPTISNQLIQAEYINESIIYTVFACEKNFLTLDCSQRGVIDVISAFFGRLDNKTCPYSDCVPKLDAVWCGVAFGVKLNTNCIFPNATQTIKKKANGLVVYKFFMCNYEYIGLNYTLNPCIQAYKYGNVSYRCI